MEDIPLTPAAAAIMKELPLLNAHVGMCKEANASLNACFAKEGISEGSTQFPEACADVAVSYMECAVAKSEKAMTITKKLIGAEAAAKAFPYYEEKKQKAVDLIQIYKEHAAGDKATQGGPFWDAKV